MKIANLTFAASLVLLGKSNTVAAADSDDGVEDKPCSWYIRHHGHPGNDDECVAINGKHIEYASRGERVRETARYKHLTAHAHRLHEIANSDADEKKALFDSWDRLQKEWEDVQDDWRLWDEEVALQRHGKLPSMSSSSTVVVTPTTKASKSAASSKTLKTVAVTTSMKASKSASSSQAPSIVTVTSTAKASKSTSSSKAPTIVTVTSTAKASKSTSSSKAPTIVTVTSTARTTKSA